MHCKTTKNFSIKSYIKGKGFSSMLNGFQPIVYGYIVSGFFYYYMYKGVKESIKKVIRRNDMDEKSLLSIAAMSAGASAICESVAVLFYYPFDLVKARMQRSGEYKYRNMSDGFYQIFKENSGNSKLANFYRGAGIYTCAYGMYTILEFTFYETILAAIVNYSKTQSVTHHEEGSTEIHEGHTHAKNRKITHVMFSAF